MKRSSSPLRGADSIMASSSSGAATDLEIKSETACFGGRLLKCVHQSKATKTPMTFTVFLPPSAASSAVPVLYYLSGLTCTDDNFIQKAGAQRIAALRGVALVAPDTSPRGAGVAGEVCSTPVGVGPAFRRAVAIARRSVYVTCDFLRLESTRRRQIDVGWNRNLEIFLAFGCPPRQSVTALVCFLCFGP
ncbi:unnamed protein product [Ectocarpus sp. 13 AM-2016]